jgi:hypothetical protein
VEPRHETNESTEGHRLSPYAPLSKELAMKRPLVARNAPRSKNDFTVYAEVVAMRLSDEPLFDPRPPTLDAFKADVATLASAVVAAATRQAGLAAAWRARAAAVSQGLSVLHSYVQGLASAKPPEEAAEVIVRAGFSVKNARGPSKRAFAVKPGRTPGSVRAYAKAAASRASYDWQTSKDGTTWVSIASTTRADATFEGLLAGRPAWFRCRSLTKDGASDWSDALWCYPR